MTIGLYFVAHVDENGDNKDLFVKAKSTANAMCKWRATYELDPAEKPDKVFLVSADLRTTGVIQWHSDECQLRFINE